MHHHAKPRQNGSLYRLFLNQHIALDFYGSIVKLLGYQHHLYLVHQTNNKILAQADL